MRTLSVAAAVSLVFAVMAQDVKRPLLSSQDKIDGPFAGQSQLEELKIFEDGRVLYVEEGMASTGVKLARSEYETHIGPKEMRSLAELLDSSQVRSLPKTIHPKTRSIDFFWGKSLHIKRRDKTQDVRIENSYPFLNSREPAYPEALIQLECILQGIKGMAAKRPPSSDWCKSLLATSKPNQPHCQEDAQPRIVAGAGWGQIHIGAASKTVNALIGEGQLQGRYSDVYFRHYPAKGVQVSFTNAANTVHAIYFYNGQQDSKEFAVFCGRTDKGIGWQSSVDEVKTAYGQPALEYSGTDSSGTWQRLVFAGIDFRFENGKMVRIGIPGQ